MVKQEVNDAHKQLSYVRSLEAKLKGKTPDNLQGTDAQDWDALSTLKKDLGMKVDFVSPTEQKEKDRAASAGWEGKEKWNEKKLGEAK